LLSSHDSEEDFIPAPHVQIQTEGYAKVQVNPNSIVQVGEHPSKLAKFPSSQNSKGESFPFEQNDSQKLVEPEQL